MATVIEVLGLPFAPDPGDDANNLMVILDYPLAATVGARVYRPTAVDGVGNSFFKALSEEEPNVAGRTLNLRNARDGKTPLDGASEFVIEPLPFSSEFGWRSVGLIEGPPPLDDTANIEAALSGSGANPEQCIDGAIAWIDACR